MPCLSPTVGNVMTERFRTDTLEGVATPPRAVELGLWPDPKVGPWRVIVWWRAQHGVPVPVGIQVTSWVEHEERRLTGAHNTLPGAEDDVPLPALTGQLVRSMPVGKFIEQTNALWWQLLHTHEQTPVPPEWQASWEAWQAESASERAAVDGGRRAGTRDLGDDHYREVARIYAEAVRRREPPTKAVAEAFTIEKSSAAKQVARARERGFLPKTTRGRVGNIKEEL